MPAPFRIWENCQVVQLLAPSADAAGRTSSYVSLKHGHKAFVVCSVNQGAASTVQFTPLQSSDSSGTGSKAIGSAPIAACLDTSTSTGSDQFTIAAAAANYTTDAGLKNKLVIFEIQPEEVMDLVSSPIFNHIAIQTGASNASNITAAWLVVTPLRDQRQNPPTTYV